MPLTNIEQQLVLELISRYIDMRVENECLRAILSVSQHEFNDEGTRNWEHDMEKLKTSSGGQKIRAQYEPLLTQARGLLEQNQIADLMLRMPQSKIEN